MKLLRLLRSPFARDSALLQGSGALIAGLQLVSTVVLANVIGETEQGSYFMALALYGLLFMLLNTGVMQATVVNLAAGAAAADADRVAAWQAFLVKVYLLAGLALAGIGLFALPWFAGLVLKDPSVGHLAWWLTLTPFLEVPRVLAQATFQASRRMADLARLELVNEAGRVVLVVCGALWTEDALGPVLGTLAASGFGSLVALRLYRAASTGEGHKLPSPRAVLGRVRDVPIRRGLALGVKVGSLRAIDALTITILPPLIMGAVGPAAGLSVDRTKDVVTHFRIAQRIIQLPIVLLQGISRTTMPALSQMAGRRDAEGFRRAWFRVTALSGLISVVGMGAVLLAQPLFALALDLLQFPASYHAPIAHMVGILAVGAAVLGLNVGAEAFYVVAGQLRAALLISIPAVTLSTALTAVLAYRLPETGLAWGVSISYALSLLHVGYILWFLNSERRRGLFGTVPATEG